MLSLSDSQHALLAFALLIASTFGTGLTASKLADRHASDIRIICYFFSLSLVCTSIGAFWATSIGAIDTTGTFQGRWGEATNALLKFMLDINTDLQVFAAVLGLFVLPQILSYVLSGLFGCAAAPILIGPALTVFVWSVVKSFAVAAGIVLPIAICGWCKGWAGWSLRGTTSMAVFSSLLLAIAFWFQYMARDVATPVKGPPTKLARRVRRSLARLDSWFTRKSPRRPNAA
jgi:hypothetical protein